MTPEQARLLVRQAFREQDLTLDVIKRSDPRLVWALRRIAGLIKTLPKPGDMMRESQWRQMRANVMNELDGYARTVGAEALETLKAEVDRSEEFARGYIRLGLEKATESGQTVKTNTAVSLGVNQAQPFQAFVLGKELTVTTGRTYFEAFNRAGVAGQSFAKAFGVKLDEAGGILQVPAGRKGVARYFMTSIDRLVMQGILEGRLTEDIAQDLIFDSIKGGLSLGQSAKSLKTSAVTVVRTAIADGLNRAHEQFWDANDSWEWTDPVTGEEHSGKIIQGWIFDAITDSRACPDCSMLDQKYAPRRDDLPAPPLHPRCRCIRRPISETERLLMREDAEEARRREKAGIKPQTVGSAVELYEAKDLPGRRRGESPKDFIKRMNGKRRAAQQDGRDLPERWYSTPVKKDGKTFYRVARDLPAFGREGVRRVPEWLGERDGNGFMVNDATRIDFFGGGKAGATRNELFKRLVQGGKSPREAMVQLLSVDKEEGRRRFRFKPVDQLKAG
jgi:hypothetical protein